MPNHSRDRIENLSPSAAVKQLAISFEEAMTELGEAREELREVKDQLADMTTRQLKQTIAILISLFLIAAGIIGNLVARTL